MDDEATIVNLITEVIHHAKYLDYILFRILLYSYSKSFQMRLYT